MLSQLDQRPVEVDGGWVRAQFQSHAKVCNRRTEIVLVAVKDAPVQRGDGQLGIELQSAVVVSQRFIEMF